MAAGRQRCDWAGSDPTYVAYHDTEWGIPLHDDRRLFELLILEGFQAGLSWITILRKRDSFREAFHRFDWKRIARYGAADVRRLMADASIVRNRLKIASAIGNAQAVGLVRDEFGSFDRYIWSFTNGRTLKPARRARSFRDLPTYSAESDAMSKDLKRRGFRFVGTTICYSYMQAAGMVDDHLATCWRARR